MASRHGHHARPDGAAPRARHDADPAEEDPGPAVGDAALRAIATAVIGQLVAAQRQRDADGAGGPAGRRARCGRDERASRQGLPLGQRVGLVMPALIAPALLGSAFIG